MKTCTECGARIEAGATACDLCGTPVDGIPQEPITDAVGQDLPGGGCGSSSDEQTQGSPPTGTDDSDDTSQGDSDDGTLSDIFCNNCGHRNPPGSRFCSKCGSELQSIGSGENMTPTAAHGTAEKASGISGKPTGKSDSGDRSSIVGRQITIIVGAGVLIVLALYMISSLSGSSTRLGVPGEPRFAAPVSGPLTGPFADKAASLVSEIGSLSGEEKIQKQGELLDLYQSATRLDLAAGVAEEIAVAWNTESSWIFAGNLYFDWMDRQSQVDVKAAYARKAVSAYGKALEINPDNLDVRTDMGIALMYDPTRAMMAIQETMKVLAIDSLHIQANFNRGIMLRQINRIDQAIAQFEKVKRIVGDPNNPVYQRAQAAIQSITGGS